MNELGQISYSMNVGSTSYSDADVIESMEAYSTVRRDAPCEVVTLDNPFKDGPSVESNLGLYKLPKVCSSVLISS